MTRADFYKSMTTHAASQVWQDVYLFDFFDRDQLLARAVDIVTQEEELTAAIRNAARAEVEARYSFDRNSLPAYLQLIGEVMR